MFHYPRPAMQSDRVQTSAPECPPPLNTLPIEGFPGYRIGDEGSVWSCRRGPQWRQLTISLQLNGYPYVSLQTGTRRGSHKSTVHRLVLEAFMGPCPPGLQCRHLDGNRQNNRLDNLTWGSASDNEADKRHHGTTQQG